MLNNSVDITQLIQQRQNKFIETRTIIDSEVSKFIKSIEELGTDLPENCRVLIGKTTKDILPALWLEPFNEAQYTLELQNLKGYICTVKSVADAINEEALKCLQQ